MEIEERKKLEQQYLLQKELSKRREDDPLWACSLSPKQKEFVDAVLHGDKTENWLCSANRFGKSHAGAYCGAHMARLGSPETGEPTSGWVIAIDNNVMRETIQPKYFNNGYWLPTDAPPFIPEREIENWSEKKQVLRLKNGSIIGFKSLASETGSFFGAGKDWVHYDEEPHKKAYDECGIRFAGGRKLRVFGTCTLLPPEGMVGGVSWVYNDIIKKIDKLPHIGLYGGSLYDNPYIGAEEKALIEKKFPPGTVMHRIRVMGEWLPGAAGARVYTHFNRQSHVVKLGDLAGNLPICWTWDFNVDPMVSIVGQYFKGVYYVYKVFMLDEGNLFSMVDLFREFYPAHPGGVNVYGDWSGTRREQQSGRSNFDMIMQKMVTYPSVCRLKVPVHNPPVSDRINAVNRALRDEEDRIGVQIHNEGCELLADDFEDVLVGVNGNIKKTNNKSSTYYFKTHYTDAMGYWVSYETPVQRATMSRVRRNRIKRASYSRN